MIRQTETACPDCNEKLYYTLDDYGEYEFNYCRSCGYKDKDYPKSWKYVIDPLRDIVNKITGVFGR